MYKLENKKVQTLFQISHKDILYDAQRQNSPYITGLLSSPDDRKFLFRSRSYGTIIHKDKEGKYKTERLFMFDRDSNKTTEFEEQEYYNVAKNFGYSDAEIFVSIGGIDFANENRENKYMQIIFGKENLIERDTFAGIIDEDNVLLQNHKKGEPDIKISAYNTKTKERKFKDSFWRLWFSFSLSPDKKCAVVSQGRYNFSTFSSVINQNGFISIIDSATFKEVKRLPAGGGMFSGINTHGNIVWEEK